MIDDNINHEYIIRYIRDCLPASEGLLAEMERYAAEYAVPISQPESIRLLELLARLGGAERILEIGTAIGYSAIRLALASGGHVDTVERSAELASLARTYISRAALEGQICVIEGDAAAVLPDLTEGYDLIFLDAAKAQYQAFFPHCVRLLRRGGLLVSDNVLYKGMTATDELLQHRKRTIVKRLRAYLEMLKEHPLFDTAVLPVGDGIALSLRNNKERQKHA